MMRLQCGDRLAGISLFDCLARSTWPVELSRGSMSLPGSNLFATRKPSADESRRSVSRRCFAWVLVVFVLLCYGGTALAPAGLNYLPEVIIISQISQAASRTFTCLACLVCSTRWAWASWSAWALASSPRPAALPSWSGPRRAAYLRRHRSARVPVVLSARVPVALLAREP